MEISVIHKLFIKHNSVSTDTRKVSKNSIYFALKGDNFNGNLFANEALKKGASYVVVDEKITEELKSSKYILVENVLETLQKLANFHRIFLNIPIIALTGSNGKTTTKELINSVLKTTYNTTATIGNLNNHIGVPLTLLSMTEETEMGIVEMGANHKKEIEFLCQIAQPNFGYITNFGKAHLEGFGGYEGVIEGKSELYTHLIDNNKTIFYNADDTIQDEKLKKYSRKIGFTSTTTKDSLHFELINVNPFIELNLKNNLIQSQLIGRYNFTNICAACTIGTYFKIEINTLKKGIENYLPKNNRSQIIEKGNTKIILDAYNANPSSMIAALSHFNLIEAQHKIAFLGDMFELGESAAQEHQNIVHEALKLKLSKLILVGDNFYKCDIKDDRILKFRTFNELKSSKNLIEINNATLLVKGSRGMALERIIDIL